MERFYKALCTTAIMYYCSHEVIMSVLMRFCSRTIIVVLPAISAYLTLIRILLLGHLWCGYTFGESLVDWWQTDRVPYYCNSVVNISTHTKFRESCLNKMDKNEYLVE